MKFKETRMFVVLNKYKERLLMCLYKEDGIPFDKFKVDVIRGYAIRSGIQTFIETGTYRGGTTVAVSDLFKRLHTIELDKYLYNISKDSLKGYTNIVCYNGDSAKILSGILPLIDEPILYWLDAHYSRGITEKGDDYTPIIRELTEILNHPHHKDSILLIDDARCFGTEDDYPTIPYLKEWIQSRWEKASFVVEDDIMRIC